MHTLKYLLVLISICFLFSSCDDDDEPVRANIQGKILWPSSCEPRDLNFILIPLNNDSERHIGSSYIDSLGAFTVEQVFIGNYDIYLKPKGYLQRKFSGIEVLECPNRVEFGPFVPGDLDDDNSVDANDFEDFSNSYGSTSVDPEYSFLADLNCDGIIDTTDFSAFSEAFGESGDEP